MAYHRGLSRVVGAMMLPQPAPKRKTRPKTIKDGWHNVKGFDIYVENGLVVRAMKYDYNNNLVSAQVYVWDSRDRIWINAKGTKFSTVKNGIYKGNYGVF